MPSPLLLPLILPLLVSAENYHQQQQNNSVPSASNAFCRTELIKIIRCSYQVPEFNYIDDVPRRNKTVNLALIEGVKQVVDCAGDHRCPATAKYVEYIQNQAWIGHTWHGELESCLLTNGLFWTVRAACPHTGPDDAADRCNRIASSVVPCVLAGLENHPQQCPSALKPALRALFNAIHHSCKLEFEILDYYTLYHIA